jgi:hypothetical protein
VFAIDSTAERRGPEFGGLIDIGCAAIDQQCTEA